MSEFVEYLHEVFADLGPIRTRRMFGGHGIYYDDVMIALVADDVVYLKADKETVADFEAEGLPAFEFEMHNQTKTMSYYQAPDEIYDDPQVAAAWGRQAYAAALRSKPRQRKKKRSTR